MDTPARGMSRSEAERELRRLAVGLRPDIDGARRFMERAASHDQAEALRDALAELGARQVLDDQVAR